MRKFLVIAVLSFIPMTASCSEVDSNGSSVLPEGFEIIEPVVQKTERGRSVAPSFNADAFCSPSLKKQWNENSSLVASAIDARLSAVSEFDLEEIVFCNIWAVETSNRMSGDCSKYADHEVQLAVAGMQTYWRQKYLNAERKFGDGAMDTATAEAGVRVAFANDEKKEKAVSACEQEYGAFMVAEFEN